MPLLRLFVMLWFFGFIALTVAALSNYLYSDEPDRQKRFSGRISAAVLWPVAVCTAAGRLRLRRGS
ncbi:MAG TPA: hypothetical protein VMF52_00950 [Steroidobacteraceae bacterium]|nr:hypothetical protein [Steroidobacteraceae bacterium]